MDMERTGDERITVDVWDWQTRALHWLNAFFVITLIILALAFEGMDWVGAKKKYREPFIELHAIVGYFFITTFILRIAWAFLGNRYAKWSDIVPMTRVRLRAAWIEITYLVGLTKEVPARCVGHNPLASFFYIFVFIVLVMQAFSGLLLAGVELGLFSGPLLTAIGGDSESFVEAAEELHKAGLFMMLFYIAAHLAGLVIHEVRDNNGIFSSMIHGKKYFSRKDL